MSNVSSYIALGDVTSITVVIRTHVGDGAIRHSKCVIVVDVEESVFLRS